MPLERASSATASAKAMRKGTRSCFQCNTLDQPFFCAFADLYLGRRRKKRCIFSADDSTACVTCKSKGFQCIEQRPEQLQSTPVDNRLNLKDRVAKLEALIQSLAPAGGGSSSADGPTDGLPDTPISFDKAPSAFSSQNANDAPKIPSSSSNDSSELLGPDIGQKIGPISSLFNNAIVSQLTPTLMQHWIYELKESVAKWRLRPERYQHIFFQRSSMHQHGFKTQVQARPYT